MGFFGNKSEGGLMDVIRCDEQDYLVWKWRPSGNATSTHKENAIRWGSSLRVKDGEVAVFVYKQENGPIQDFIEGPFDDTIKTANFPVISNIIGLAYAGQSPFQAEVYFINRSGNIRIPFRTPWFLVADPRFADFPVKLAAGGSFRFNISDYRTFVRLYRLVNFEVSQLADTLRDAVLKNVKGIVVNAPIDNGIPVLQIERKLLELNDLITPRISKVLTGEFGVNLQGFDLATIEIDHTDAHYDELRRVTGDLEIQMRQAQNVINIENLQATQEINAQNMSETLRIQREQAERLARLQTEQQYLAAHQIDQQTAVLTAAADSLGAMGEVNLGSGGGGGFNPIGLMTGMAVGGAMGGQMAGMMNTAGQNAQQAANMPPPPPQIAYHISVNGQNAGPFTMAQLQQMALAGQFGPAIHVWKQGMANWELAGNVADLAPLFAQTPPPPPPPGI
jgi:membrane protease subunit (stomatin/prohibitin family)